VPGITNPAEEYFKNGLWVWNGSTWVKCTELWGAPAVLFDAVEDLTATAGTNNLNGAVVPTGEIWEVTHIAAWDATTAPGEVWLRVNHDASYYTLERELTLGVDVTLSFTGSIWLDAGDYVMARFASCTLNDDIYLHTFGRKLKTG